MSRGQSVRSLRFAFCQSVRICRYLLCSTLVYSSRASYLPFLLLSPTLPHTSIPLFIPRTSLILTPLHTPHCTSSWPAKRQTSRPPLLLSPPPALPPSSLNLTLTAMTLSLSAVVPLAALSPLASPSTSPTRRSCSSKPVLLTSWTTAFSF